MAPSLRIDRRQRNGRLGAGSPKLGGRYFVTKAFSTT
jgi:hypothetical protein